MEKLIYDWPIMGPGEESIYLALEKLLSRLPPKPKVKPERIDVPPGEPAAFKSRHSSRCLICGRIFYNEMRLVCNKCKGHCRICPPDELALSARWGGRDGW